MKKFTKLASALMILILSSAIAMGQSDAIKLQKIKDAQQKLAFDVAEGVVPGTPTFTAAENYATSNAPESILWDNGPLITLPGGGSGGTDYSELQDATLGMSTYGTGFQISAGNSIADDFDVTGTWTVTSFTFFGYQTGSGPPSTLNDVRFQIYDGDPSAGGSVIFGDLNTPVMISTEWTNIWRVLESAPEENRPIMQIVADASGLVLSEGTYWVEWQVGGTGSSGPWAPPISITGVTNTGNAIQHTSTGWAPFIDVDPQGMPFIVEGTAGPLPDNDIGVSQIMTPVSGPDLTNAEVVTVKIMNMGNNPQSNFDVSYTIDGGAAVTETVSATINSLETYDYTFAATADLSVYGIYAFEACTMLAGDENADNNCKTKDVENYAPSYCDATTGTEDEIIGHVVCGDIDNTSGWQGGVADYTDQSTAIDAGGSVDITVTNTGGIYTSDITYVWVDWNDDFTFEQGGEEEFQLENVGGTGETFTGTVTAPGDAMEGTHRMRVRMTWSSAPVPCGDASYGEVEDYSILVGENEFPAPTGLAGTVNGNDVSLTWTAPGGATPTDYDVYRDGSVIGNTTDLMYDDMDLDPGTYEYCVKAIYDGGVSVCSNSFEATIEESPYIFFDDFEAYNAGEQVACQNPEDWTTWSNAPCGSEDAYVSDAFAYSGDNSANVVTDNDLVYELDDYYTSGAYSVGMMVYIPSGFDGYYNVLTDFGGGASPEWGFEVYFNVGGDGSVNAGATAAATFDYNFDTWMYSEVVVDLDGDQAWYYLDGNMIVSWQWTAGAAGGGAQLQLAALDFFGATATTSFYFDDFTLNEADVPQLDPPTNLTSTQDAGNVVLNWDAPSGGSVGSILVVDRDGSADLAFTDTWQFIQPALDANGFTYDYYEVTDLTMDGPDLTTMADYDVILWFAGESWQNGQTMSDNDEINLSLYLSGGGSLLLSAHDFLWDRYPSAGAFSAGQFPYDYLGLASVAQDNWSIFTPDVADIAGTSGSFVEGLSFQVADIYSAKDGLYIDDLTPLGQGLFDVTNPSPAGMCAVQYEGSGFRTAFTTASIAAITDAGAMADVLGSAVNWLSGNKSAKDLTGYNVYENLDGGAFSLLGTTTETTYTDEGPSFGLHCYYVTAVYDMGESTGTDEACELITGVEEILAQSTAVFPNPATDVVNIQSDFNIMDVKVYNYAGQMVRSEIVDNKIYQLNTSELNAGFYFFQINTTEGSISKRIVIQ